VRVANGRFGVDENVQVRGVKGTAERAGSDFVRKLNRGVFERDFANGVDDLRVGGRVAEGRDGRSSDFERRFEDHKGDDDRADRVEEGETGAEREDSGDRERGRNRAERVASMVPSVGDDRRRPRS